jgi:ferredoxin
MIVGERKPFDEIKESIKGYKNILILGCGTCVSVSMAGGEKEVEILASQLNMVNKLEGPAPDIAQETIQRQCDREYIEPIIEMARGKDAVVSMACGAGVQFLSELLESVPVIPAVNTRFIGVTEAEGSWSERCRACGDCKLAHYGGICPVTICAKGLLNGPCGGASLGKCEAGNERDCAWELIYNRLKQQGRLDSLQKTLNFYDNQLQSHPARIIKE